MLPAARRTQRKIPSVRGEGCGRATQRGRASPHPCRSQVPYKVLDAPALQDDFYLHLVDWSSTNVLAVGLGACVYLWSACTSKARRELGQL